MSMWEIEALMENTIRVIDKSELSAPEKRNLIWNAYHLQGQFDCSFTHFRVMDILLKYEYVQTYSIEDFPIDNTSPAFIQALRTKDFEWIRKKPTEGWAADNPALAYWDRRSEKIYTDFGSELYTLHPQEQPQLMSPLALGTSIIQLSAQQEDSSTIYDWTAFLLIYILGWWPSDESIEQLKEHYFSTIKAIFQQYDYSSYEALHRGLDLTTYQGDALEDLSAQQIALINYITKN